MPLLESDLQLSLLESHNASIARLRKEISSDPLMSTKKRTEKVNEIYRLTREIKNLLAVMGMEVAA
ncbi:hypothetical protein D770_20425 [Flammeovirgaceae bacterium 311]|nr:hypothetical protein D770_20425 [Flammeovirgaceae bacterium 311]